MRHNKNKKGQAGYSLLEITMVAGIIIIFSVAVIIGYRIASDSTNLNKAVNNLNSLTAGVRNIFATQGDYNGLTNAVIVSSNSIPEDMRVPGNTTQIKSPWANNGITVTPVNVGGTADDGFEMKWNNVPRSACQDFVTKVYRSYTVQVGGGAAVTGVAGAATACNGTGNVTITFTTR